MDTTTVLEIIEMIGNQLDTINNERIVSSERQHYLFVGKKHALQDLRDHLQGYIESQVSAVENQTGE